MTDVLSTLELPLLERLRSQLRSFSPAERRVADTILRDPLGIIHLSVSELATLAETSAATVVRLCTSIGLRGYQELKITLATQSIPSEKRVLDAVDSGDDVRTVSQKVLAGTAAAVEATAAVLDTGELERIAEAILGASRIQFGAVGTSAPLAQDAAYRLTTIGIPATFISPPGTPAATSTPSSRRTPATPSGPSWRNRTRGVWAPTSPTSSRAPSSSPTAADGPPRPPPTGSPHISTEQSAHRPPHSLLGVRWPHPLLFGVHMLGIVSTPDGTPIADVAVSNGRDVVLTDADGRFELPAATPFVTVTVPAGYSTGTWWLPASDDTQLAFVLEPREQTLPYEFIHLTDTHLTIPTVEAVNSGLYSEGSIPSELTAFLSSLPDRAPAAQAIFVTGDLADHGIAEEFEAFSDAVANSPLPMRVVPGNHDHMNGTHGSIISRNNYLTNTGDPALYERMIGPRWYSFDIPGLHVVAMDWHSHETGHDHDLQNAWLNADLAVREPGSPWMLLFHDQPGSSLLEHAPWHPIAAFSGHWHTSRVVRVDGTLHVNSPTTFFAGLDYSPPAYRRVIWDGEQITLHTETVTIVPDPAPLGDTSRATFAPAGHDTPADDAIVWRAQLHGAGHRQNVTVDGEIVFAGAQIEDEPLGFVEALDLATGTPVWTTEVESAVKTAPVVWGDTVIAATVSGDVHGLDRTTGERRWILPSSDPLRRFAWNAPTVHDGVIYIGDQADLRAIDAATGDVLWRRTDIAPHHNLVNHSRPLIIDDLLVMGFWPTPQHPVGLNRHTGESVWATGDNSGELFTALKALLIMGTATYDAAEDAVLMPAFAHTARVDRETGAIEWVTAHPGAFSPASPIVTPSGYVVTATGHGLLMLDPTTGDIRWDREITGEAPFPMRSYSKAPHPVIAPPTPIADRLVLPGLDGLIRVFDLDGNLLGQSQIGSPLAAELTVAGDLLLTVGTDGIVIALSTPALLARATNNSDAHAEVSA